MKKKQTKQWRIRDTEIKIKKKQEELIAKKYATITTFIIQYCPRCWYNNLLNLI